jgi:hypothetical protein
MSPRATSKLWWWIVSKALDLKRPIREADVHPNQLSFSRFQALTCKLSARVFRGGVPVDAKVLGDGIGMLKPWAPRCQFRPTVIECPVSGLGSPPGGFSSPSAAHLCKIHDMLLEGIELALRKRGRRR